MKERQVEGGTMPARMVLLAVVVVTAVIGTLAGLGASGAFDSSPTEFPPMESPPADARTPAPTAPPTSKLPP